METIALAVREQQLPRNDLVRVTVDTTVQEKKITFGLESRGTRLPWGSYDERHPPSDPGRDVQHEPVGKVPATPTVSRLLELHAAVPPNVGVEGFK